MDLTLHNLIVISKQKQFNSKVFASLFTQLNEKSEISSDDYIHLLDYAQEDLFRNLQISYILEVAFSSNFFLKKFFKKLASLSWIKQRTLIFKFIQYLKSQPPNGLRIDLEEFTVATYPAYLTEVLGKEDVSPKLVETIIFTIDDLSRYVQTIPIHIRSAYQIVLNRIIEICKSNQINLVQFITRNLGSLLSPNELVPKQTISHTNTISLKVKKMIWFSNVIQNWKFHDTNFLAHFETYCITLNSQTKLNPLKKAPLLMRELIQTSFNCFASAIISKVPTYLSNTWKYFIIKKLPILLISMKFDAFNDTIVDSIQSLDSNVVKVLTNLDNYTTNNSSSTNNMEDEIFNDFPTAVEDLRHIFLKNCIMEKVIDQDLFTTIFPQTHFKSNSMGSVDLEEEFNRELLDIDPEFTSIDESNFISFLLRIPELPPSEQLSFSIKVLDVIDTLIRQKQFSRLRRLLLSITTTKDILDIVIFYSTPYPILNHLVQTIDFWENSEEELNFQENYIDFGVILLSSIKIIKKYNVNKIQLINNIKFSKMSFCLNFISHDGLIDQDISEQDELISEWISALFDQNGISDELIKMSNNYKIFQVIPHIFKQAIFATKKGLLDFEVLTSAVEYLYQPILMPCLYGLINWMLEELWTQSSEISDLLIKLLHNFIVNNSVSGLEVSETNLIFKILVSMLGWDIVNSLEEYNDASISDIKTNVAEYLSEHTNPVSQVVQGYLKNDKSASRGDSPISSIFSNYFYQLINWNNQTHNNLLLYQYNFGSNLIDMTSNRCILMYWLREIYKCQLIIDSPQVNSQVIKNFNSILELSCFMITVSCVNSNEERDYWVEKLTSLEYSSYKPEPSSRPLIKPELNEHQLSFELDYEKKIEYIEPANLSANHHFLKQLVILNYQLLNDKNEDKMMVAYLKLFNNHLVQTLKGYSCMTG